MPTSSEAKKLTPAIKSSMLGPTSGSTNGGDQQKKTSAGSRRSRSRSRSPAPFKVGAGAHNRFHYNCCTGPKKAPSLEDVKTKSTTNAAKRRKSRMSGSQSQNDLCAHERNNAVIHTNGSKSKPTGSTEQLATRNTTEQANDDMTKEQMETFLSSNPEFLENFVLNNVELETLERWTIRRARRVYKGHERSTALTSGRALKPSLTKWRFCVHADKRAMLQDMTSKIQEASSTAQIINELATCIAGALDADTFNLYMTNELEGTLERFVNEDGGMEVDTQQIGSGSTMAAYVAKTKEILRTSTANEDPRFPHGIPTIEGPHHVLLYPVVTTISGELVAVLEFARAEADGEFHEEDEEIANSYLVWGEVAIHYAELYLKVKRQRNLNNFLLTVVRSIFMEMVSMDSLIIKIMNFAQTLVDADRASLFLVDAKTNQLYARIFDISGENDPEQEVVERDVSKEIRFPVGIGIAGYVAETGETMNVKNAYDDARFNKGIDEQTGYNTRTILCMPICIRGQVIGIVQMINKKNGVFTKEDEESFEMFSIYCGLALHHAKLYDKIRRSEQKYKVALEVLSYHNSSSSNEVEQLVEEGVPPGDDTITDFTFYALNLDDMDKVRKALFMFVDLFGTERFDYETLVRFTITVRKNYRQVAYHNWTHGFHVANSIYSILKSSPGIFRPLECLSMFVGAICHDLDHRGFNNKFMIDVGSPLAAIYSTSTMEHHHFNMTVNILQQENHNIFAKLNPDEYRQVLGNIKHCILATDLALFFPNKARLSNILKEGAFSWDLPDHRLLVEAVVMTASDLCASAKPWDLQLSTVSVIYEEFYRQGDCEVLAGRVPVPIMNRHLDSQQANHQVGFIGGICLPCYDLLVQVLPDTSPMQQQCASNLSTWKERAEHRKRELMEVEAQKNEEEDHEESSHEEDTEEE